MNRLSQEQVQQLYEQGGFLLMDGLDEGAEFGIDGKIWAVKEFKGMKILPPSLHLITLSTASQGDSAAGVGLRKAFLHFVQPKEVLTRSWNARTESLKSEEARPAKRRRMAAAFKPEEETVVSMDIIKSMDSHMAPYPFDVLETWQSLTSLCDATCIGRVIGFDQAGDAILDSLTPTLSDLRNKNTATIPKQTWGKERPADEEEQMNGIEHDQTGTGLDEEEALQFTTFDVKRSWPPGASGDDLTTHSRDKSWLLLSTVRRQLKRDSRQLLAEMQLSFILFLHCYNFSSLDTYKNIMALLCNAKDVLLPKNPNLPATGCGLPFYTDLLRTVLLPQLSSLREGFFELDLPDLDTFILQELQHLRDNLRSAGRQWTKLAHDANNDWRDLVKSWNLLSEKTEKLFGWDLGSIDKPLAIPKKTLHYDLLQDAGSDDEFGENEEDAPVIVQLD